MISSFSQSCAGKSTSKRCFNSCLGILNNYVDQYNKYLEYSKEFNGSTTHQLKTGGLEGTPVSQ